MNTENNLESKNKKCLQDVITCKMKMLIKNG